MVEPEVRRDLTQAPGKELRRITVIQVVRKVVHFRRHDVEGNADFAKRKHFLYQLRGELVHVQIRRIELLCKNTVADYIIKRRREIEIDEVARNKRSCS